MENENGQRQGHCPLERRTVFAMKLPRPLVAYSTRRGDREEGSEDRGFPRLFLGFSYGFLWFCFVVLVAIVVSCWVYGQFFRNLLVVLVAAIVVVVVFLGSSKISQKTHATAVASDPPTTEVVKNGPVDGPNPQVESKCVGGPQVMIE